MMAVNTKTWVFKHLFDLAIVVVVLMIYPAEGLRVGFYEKSCPLAEAITKNVVKQTLAVSPSLSGPLLRMFYHDCFVRVSIYFIFLLLHL